MKESGMVELKRDIYQELIMWKKLQSGNQGKQELKGLCIRHSNYLIRNLQMIKIL